MSLIMIISWFRYGHLYGGGDVGLPTYDPVRILSIVKNIWWDVHAPGFPYATALTSIPFYLVLATLQTFGLSNIVIQALVFGILLFLTGAGMYLLFFETADSKSKTLSFIAAVFYMLNPYMITQIWHRFVHTAFILAALIPVLSFFYIKIIKTRSFFWFVCFLGISFASSYTYGSLPFMVVIWIPLFIYSLWKKSILIFLLMFGSWLITNVWWLYPFWTTGPSMFAQIYSIYTSISTLISISAQSTMPMVLRGINPFYTFGDNAWVPGYGMFFMQIISWTFPYVILIGIYSILFHRRKDYYVWILLFLVGVFISKGIAAPFGYPFLWFFSKSFLLGAFRNPFEKFGIIVPLASAFIFPLGIETLFLWLKNRFKDVKYISIGLISILLILQFGVYGWPMWAGKMFGTFDNLAFVKVPDSYKQADDWISSQRKSGRILQLPYAPGDAVTYFWDKGYNGIEPSSLLFKTPSVSQGFGLGFLDSDLDVIRTIFSPDNFNKEDVSKVLSSLNVRYIILHNDVDWKTRELLDPESLKQQLSKIDFIKVKATFGNLVIYEVDGNFVIPKVYTTDVSDSLTGDSKYFSLWPEIFSNRNWPVSFITPVNGNTNLQSSYKNIDYSIAPIQIIDTLSSPLAYKENALGELPQPRFLPDSPFYLSILLKEQMEIFSTPILNRYSAELNLAGKRLVEAYMLSKKGNVNLADSTLKRYLNELDIALDLIGQKQKSGSIGDVEELILQKEFAKHEIVLVDLNDNKNLDNLKSRLSKMGFIPYYDLKEEMGMSRYGRRVYRFDVQKEASYEILIKDFHSGGLYKNNLEFIPIQIDNNVKLLKTNKNGDFISLGFIKLSKGLHEFSYNLVGSIDLIPEIGSGDWEKIGSVNIIKDNGQDALEFATTKSDPSGILIPIKNFDNNAMYQVNFDYWIKNGQGPRIQVQQSSDWYNTKDERFMDVNRLYDGNNYSFYWNQASEIFSPRSNTDKVIVKIDAEPWNNCFRLFDNKKICLNKETYKKYNRESDFIIKNLSVKRLFVNDIMLKSSDNKPTGSEIKEVSINQKSPSYYEGEVNLEGPTSLIFLTTFHPEWRLSLIKNGKTEIVPEDRHFLANGYGNAWYLNEESGAYKIKIEFLPQQRFYYGIVVSVISTTILITVVFVYTRKKKK